MNEPLDSAMRKLGVIARMLASFIPAISQMAAADEGAPKPNWPVAVNHRYAMNEWVGKEQVITRLNQADKSFEFVRISRNLFEIRRAGGRKEILFRFDSEYDDGGVILADGRLVDVFEDGKWASALMYGNKGYFLALAQREAPKLAKGMLYSVPKSLRIMDWHPVRFICSQDYYPQIVRNPIDSKIQAARLVGAEAIEFSLKDEQGGARKPDVFTFNGNVVIKNGVESGQAVVLNFMNDEQTWLKIMDHAKEDKSLKAQLLKNFSRDDLLSMATSASSPEIHEKLVALVEVLYGPAPK